MPCLNDGQNTLKPETDSGCGLIAGDREKVKPFFLRRETHGKQKTAIFLNMVL